MRTLTALPTFDNLAIVFENCEELSVPLDDIRELSVSSTRNTDATLVLTYRPRYRRLLAHNDITQLHLELDGENGERCVVEWFTVMYEEDSEGNNALQATVFQRPAYVSVRVGNETKTEEDERYGE